MISRLVGVLAMKKAPQILIDCNGVGYEADVPMTTFYQLPEVGQQISIWTHEGSKLNRGGRFSSTWHKYISVDDNGNISYQSNIHRFAE